MRNYISPIIIEKKPELLKTEYRNFSRFIDHFYTFLEEKGNPLEVLENFYEQCEVNNEVEGFIDKLLNECGFDIQKTLTISKKELILHLRDFYLSRGSESSFKFLFKILYNCDVLIDYPRKKMLIPSQATYSGRYYVFTTTNNLGTAKFERILALSDSYELILRGVSSKVVCSVESLGMIHSLNLTYLKIQIDAPYRLFQKGEGIEIIAQSSGEKIIENFVDNLGIEIVEPGNGYAIGDRITISNSQVIGNARVKTLKEGTISDVEIVNGGTGYSIGDQILSEIRSKGHSFSAVVSRVDNSGNYLSIPNHSSLNLTSGDFTIECWVNMPVSITDSFICSNKSLHHDQGWTFKINGNRKLVFEMFGTTNYSFKSTRTVQSNRWVHVAAVRKDNTVCLFVDGVKSSEDIVVSGTPSSDDMRIGMSTDSKYPFIGFLDELRITKGKSRYLTNFSIPVQDFDNTDSEFSSVSLLIHFDGINNSTVFTDSSNENHTITTHGSIYNSKETILFSDTSGYFSGLGSIEAISIFNHGYGYDSPPVLLIKSKMGESARLRPLSDTIGQIESIEILDPFVDSSGTPSVSVSSKNGTGAVLNAVVQPVFKEKPSWKSLDGVLGINSTLLDSYYYQQFSYYTYSPIPRKESDAILNEWCHPSGFVRFSILDISYADMLRPPNGGFDNQFYLTIIKLIFGQNPVMMVNPIYNLHWFKELSNKNFTNWVKGFDWIEEEWTNDARYYMSQALDIYPVTKFYTIRDPRLLLNPQSGLNWFKECQDNYSYVIDVWDDLTSGDPPIMTNNPSLLARKKVNDDTLMMNKALDAQIDIL